MISPSPLEKMDQLIAVYSQRLKPLALRRLSVAEILRDGAALAILQEELPSVDELHISKQHTASFRRLLKFLHLHEPTGYERDEEHKRTAVRYLALRTMLQECRDVKISNIQEACLAKLFRWFEETEADAFASVAASTPILPPRMSPKKPTIASAELGRSSSETNLPAEMTSNSLTAGGSMAEKLEKYKMPNLRASHIRRIAELRSRGADISEEVPPVEEENNHHKVTSQRPTDVQAEAQRQLVDATFNLYRPETSAEREMNLLWLSRRKEEEVKRRKELEVQQQVHRWGMDRSRDESEYLRKRESTKLVAGLEHMLQEEVNPGQPFIWGNGSVSRPDLTGIKARSKHPTEQQASSAAIKTDQATTGSLNPPKQARQDTAVTRKPLTASGSEGTNGAHLVMRSKKPSGVSTGGGMHFRNELPANYVPPGHVSTAPSGFKDRRGSRLAMNSSVPVGKQFSETFSSSKQDALDDSSSESDGESGRETGQRGKHENARGYEGSPGQHGMRFQAYHVPYYYTEEAPEQRTVTPVATNAASSQKLPPRGTIPVQPLPADPEFRRFHEAASLRRTIAITPETVTGTGIVRKRSNSVLTGAIPSEADRDSVASRAPPERAAAGASRVLKGSGNTRGRGKSRTAGVGLPRGSTVGTFGVASTSDLRQQQMEEMEKIRRLFEENHLTFSPQAFERGLFVPEDKPLLESIYNLPLAGSRLVANPLARKTKSGKTKKKGGAKKKKKKKKDKKGTKGPKTPKGSRPSSRTK